MSDFPFTDEQVEQFCRAAALGENLANDVLNRLHKAGIKVVFPRFTIRKSGPVWMVLPVGNGSGSWFAAFDSELDINAEEHAREHAARLNREVGE